MKKLKFLAPIVAVTALSGIAPVITGCNQKTSVKVNSIVINNGQAVELTRKESKALSVRILPENAENKNVTWISSDASKVSIDATGKIVGLGITTEPVTITALANDGSQVKGTVKVSVNPYEYSDIFEIDETNHILKGFKPELTTQQIEDFCKGTLTIPADVIAIAPYAFVNAAEKKSTIPSSIKRLTFAFDENGRNWLEGTAQLDSASYGRHGIYTAAIGDYSFAYAPFEFVDFPFDMVYDSKTKKYDGHRYDIGIGAFFGSKIKILNMPSPGYNLEDATLPDGRKVYKGNMKIFGDDEEFGKGPNIGWGDFQNAGFGYINKFAFTNCDNLTSVIWSLPQLAGGNVEWNAFGVANEQGSAYANTPSNINYVDLSGLSITRVKYDESKQTQIYDEIAKAEKEMIDSKTFDMFWGWGGDKLRLNYKISNNGLIKIPNYAVMCFLTGSQPTAWSRLSEYLQSFTRNLAVGKTGKPMDWGADETIEIADAQAISTAYSHAGVKLDSYSETYIKGSTWYIGYDSSSIDSEFDEKVKQPLANNQNWINNIYRFKDTSIDVSISGFDQNKFYLNNSLTETTQEIAYNLPTDLQFEIVSQEWTGGEAKIALEQIPKTDVDPSEQATYKNNYYRVVSKGEALPAVGSKVVLSVKISSKLHNIDNIVASLTINFK